MSRGTFLPTHYGYDVFTPIPIDMDGPFGFSVCQPSTVPRLFTQSQRKVSNPGIYGAVSLETSTQDVYGSNKSVPTLGTLDELEELQLQSCGNNNSGITSGFPRRDFASRKMSTMPRPFAMGRKHSPNKVRRSFSVDVEPHSSNMEQCTHSAILRACDPSKYEYCDSPTQYRDMRGGRCSRNGSYKPKHVTKCLYRVGSHIVTILCTLLIIAGTMYCRIVMGLLIINYY